MEHVHIEIDHERLLVEVRVEGYFDPDRAIKATEKVRDAVRSLGALAGRHVTLYDVSDVGVSPGTTVEAIRRAFADPAIRPLWARKVAYWTPSTLARMQLKRLRAARGDIGVFADRESALAWLFEE